MPRVTTKASPAKAGAPRTAKAAVPPRKAVAAKKVTAAKNAAPAAPAKRTAAKALPAKAASAKAAPAKVVAKKAAAPVKKAPVAKKANSAAVDKFLDAQRALLFDERATYTRQAESLKAEADLLAEDREPGDVQFDEESGEGDTLAVERERDLALSAQARGAVEEIDRMLGKITAGTYGICEQCGEPIPKERLRALPYAALCVKCKSGGLGRR